ncbi:hypothetical protein RHMOL_Rhmol09G0173200 [Rhododendron molle]|uniref:Uncharacterized protein n=1 Tax=Rhododendron molle TaxID=49168 RepID=A0ACC0MFR9_RHOML|nr:hypothetical protein RHMOL_Rhmol09G0173200 [Rhododendron molle]
MTDITTSGSCQTVASCHACHSLSRAGSSTPKVPSTVVPQLQPQVRWDYPLSLNISKSGGNKTYKDSPSNGERTGNSPA